MARPVSDIASTSIQSKPVQPKVQWRSAVSFRHDLFKLGLAVMRKNVSWKKFRPELVPMEHTHFFHTHSSSGTKQEHSVPVGGHFHKVEVFVNPDGSMGGKCGPALRKVDKKLSNGVVKTSIELVKFSHEEQGDLQDDHTHEVLYLGSEMINPQKVKDIQSKNANYVMEHSTTTVESSQESDLTDVTAE